MLMKDDKFNKVVVSVGTTKNNYHGSLYVKAVLNVLQKPVELCGGNDISFKPEEKDGRRM